VPVTFGGYSSELKKALDRVRRDALRSAVYRRLGARPYDPTEAREISIR
jgi:hypothetical protein